MANEPRNSNARELVQLVYVSAVVHPLSAAEIESIAARSKANNHARGLTGLLLHQGSWFYGMLEGPRRRVLERMEVIITDRRHRDLRILREEVVAARRFQNWSFGSLPNAPPGSGEAQVSGDFILNLSRRLR